jgi:hypothetical protein
VQKSSKSAIIEVTSVGMDGTVIHPLVANRGLLVNSPI